MGHPNAESLTVRRQNNRKHQYTDWLSWALSGVEGMDIIARDVLIRLESALEDVSGRDEKLKALFQDVCHPIEDHVDVGSEFKKFTLYYEVSNTWRRFVLQQIS